MFDNSTIFRDGIKYKLMAHGKWTNVVTCYTCDAIWSMKHQHNYNVCPECASSDVKIVKGRWNTYRNDPPWWKIFSFDKFLIVPELYQGD